MLADPEELKEIEQFIESGEINLNDLGGVARSGRTFVNR